ncbi:hypothetical protein [Aeromonas jandaei]|uniref:hypothetical protein n=1 Tax=Aeromonas jandaei TaxID=650 RepID=UPI003BA2925A
MTNRESSSQDHERNVVQHLTEIAATNDEARRVVEYLIKIATMDDEALYRECRENFGNSALSDEAASPDWFWMTSACFKEAKRRGKSEIYSQAYDDNGKTDMPPPFEFKVQSFSKLKGSKKTTITTVGSHKLAIEQCSYGVLFIWMDDMSVFRCEAARCTATGGTEVIEGSLHIGDKGSSEAWLAEWWTKMRDAEF